MHAAETLTETPTDLQMAFITVFCSNMIAIQGLCSYEIRTTIGELKSSL